ncbi:hypothetical protein [Mediterraneibacter massiliensis]|uniref:hypothetical protein n=1 Tax=Mediterraneibacter massiliensis TaxID=1720300 RepID=UPI0022E3C635|nr:hypothetical protein [Mediterraneibacter massiliensis]
MEKESDKSARRKSFLYETEIGRFLAAGVIIAILMLIIYRIFPVQFETNDDSSMMNILSGRQTGNPEVGTIYSNIVRDYGISFLYKIFPGFSWYTITTILLLYFANVIILKTIFRIFVSKGWALWKGTLFYLVFYFLCIHYSIVFIQFTTLAGILGAAAIALITGTYLNESKAIRIIDGILAILLIFVSYITRPLAGKVVLVCSIFAMLIKLFCSTKKSWKQKGILYSTIFMSAIILIAGASAIHQKYYGAAEWKAYREYNVQRAQFCDYPRLSYEEGRSIYEKAGWSEELYELVNGWFFMDKAVTKENFQIINEAYVAEQNSLKNQIISGIITLQQFLISNKLAFYTFFGSVVCLLGITAIVCVKKERRHLLWIFSGMLLGGGLLFYLSFKGRILIRVYLLCLVPLLCLLVLQMLLMCSKNCKIEKRIILGVLCICGIFAFANIKEVNKKMQDPLLVKEIQEKAVLDEYCASHPDNLYIYALSVVSSRYSPWENENRNTTLNYFSWGGATMFSPIYYERLEANGLSELYADKFFEDNVYFVNNDNAILNSLINYLSKTYDCTVKYEIVEKVADCSVIKFSCE